VALKTSDAGLTQVLAAGPQLVRQWEHADSTQAPQCYGKAVITAALDARQVGTTAPVTREFLTAAAPEYLSSPQQATAGSDWFELGLEYATLRLHGATAYLIPVAAGIGRITGYVTADYLHQYARRVRRVMSAPPSMRPAPAHEVAAGAAAPPQRVPADTAVSSYAWCVRCGGTCGSNRRSISGAYEDRGSRRKGCADSALREGGSAY
jgi:hypothetical protein